MSRAGSDDRHQALLPSSSDGDYEPAAVRELIDESTDELWSCGRHDDAVVGRARNPSDAAFRAVDSDVLATERIEPDASCVRKRFYALDRDYLSRQLREDRRLVSGACAHLQYAIAAAWIQRLDHRRNHERLGDGLPFAYWEGSVFIRIVFVRIQYEDFSRHPFHRFEDAAVSHSLSQMRHQSASSVFHTLPPGLACQTVAQYGRPRHHARLTHGGHRIYTHARRVLKPLPGNHMVDDICYTDATELARRIAAKDLSPVEVIRAHLERINSVNSNLNAIVDLQAESALVRAREAESAIARGERWGPLHGVPFTIKDCIDNKGVRTTRGSLLFADYYPRDDATVVKRLLGAGGIFLGKTNMPEFALWWETGNLVHGFTENPWMLGRTCGGSSGGEASAIAGGLSPLGVGSDVGGSIRWPAHATGIVGLKPTHGRVPLTGHFPETLLRYMHVGPMARTVRDVGLALSIMSGPDDSDPYALPVPIPDFDGAEGGLAGLKIGFCAEGPFAPVMEEIQEVVGLAAVALEGVGCRVDEVDLHEWNDRQAQDISMSFFLGEGAFDLDPVIDGRVDELAPSMQRRLDQPRPSADDYYRSVQDTEWLRQDVKRMFASYDLLLLPTSTTTAFEHDSPFITIDGQKVHGRNSLRITVPFDLTGSPAVSVPFGWSSEGLPIGVQIVGRHFDEPTVLRAAAALETIGEGSCCRPDL